MSAHPTQAVTNFAACALPLAFAASIQRSREIGQRCADYNAAVGRHQRAAALLAESRIALARAQKKAATPRRMTADDRRLMSAVRKVLG